MTYPVKLITLTMALRSTGNYIITSKHVTDPGNCICIICRERLEMLQAVFLVTVNHNTQDNPTYKLCCTCASFVLLSLYNHVADLSKEYRRLAQEEYYGPQKKGE